MGNGIRKWSMVDNGKATGWVSGYAVRYPKASSLIPTTVQWLARSCTQLNQMPGEKKNGSPK